VDLIRSTAKDNSVTVGDMLEEPGEYDVYRCDNGLYDWGDVETAKRGLTCRHSLGVLSRKITKAVSLDHGMR
jgi:hypothetical protein